MAWKYNVLSTAAFTFECHGLAGSETTSTPYQGLFARLAPVVPEGTNRGRTKHVVRLSAAVRRNVWYVPWPLAPFQWMIHGTDTR
jgi:hypothetical protein